MSTKTNTTKSITSAETEHQSIKESLEQARAKFKDEKAVEVSVPKSFEKSIGKTLFIGINGVHIVLPVDGTKHKIPQSFAEHLSEYLNGLQ